MKFVHLNLPLVATASTCERVYIQTSVHTVNRLLMMRIHEQPGILYRPCNFTNVFQLFLLRRPFSFSLGFGSVFQLNQTLLSFTVNEIYRLETAINVPLITNSMQQDTDNILLKHHMYSGLNCIWKNTK